MTRMTCHFEFTPLQYVEITLFGLGYKGRVARCILRSNAEAIYEVEFAVGGEFQRREFFADEIEATE